MNLFCLSTSCHFATIVVVAKTRDRMPPGGVGFDLMNWTENARFEEIFQCHSFWLSKLYYAFTTVWYYD